MSDLTDTAREAQRARLRAVLAECGWNMSEAARRLGSNSSNVLRSVRALLPDDYAAAKADGRVRIGGYRPRVTIALTETKRRAKVAA